MTGGLTSSTRAGYSTGKGLGLGLPATSRLMVPRVDGRQVASAIQGLSLQTAVVKLTGRGQRPGTHARLSGG